LKHISADFVKWHLDLKEEKLELISFFDLTEQKPSYDAILLKDEQSV